MIRFIDIGKQITCSDEDTTTHFAWWDTVTDSFLNFNGEQAFETWEEFESSTKADKFIHDLNRYKYLFTKGKFDTDEECLTGGGEDFKSKKE